MEELDGDLQNRRRKLVHDDIGRAADSSGELFKWFVTSLLLLNGGAIVSLMRVDQLRKNLLGDYGWYFGIGLLSALLAGFILFIGMSLYGHALVERLWSGESFDEETYLKFTDKSRQGMGALGIGMILSLVSAGFFIFGCMAVANSTNSSPPGSEISNVVRGTE